MRLSPSDPSDPPGDTASPAPAIARRGDLFGHPRGLAVLFATEMWERFSYYGMRGILIFYLTQHFLFSDQYSGGIYGSYTSLVYLLPLIGGILAIGVLLTRWQAVHLLPAEWYYRLLGVHGMNMLIFFIIYFEMAVLWFAGTVLLNARPAAPRYGWFNFGLMLTGTLLVEWAQWTGRADVLFTSYPPLKAHPIFYLGIILFAVGALGVTGQFFATLTIARRERRYEGSMPLVVYGALTAAIIAIFTIASGAISLSGVAVCSLNCLKKNSTSGRTSLRRLRSGGMSTCRTLMR